MEERTKFRWKRLIWLIIPLMVLAAAWYAYDLTNYRTYQIFLKGSASGLSVGADVELNGVDVGRVKRITIDPKRPQVIDVIISIKRSTPITQGTVAAVAKKELATRGVTSLVYIALSDAGKKVKPIIAKKGDLPIIPTVKSEHDSTEASLAQINKNVQQLSDLIQFVLDKDNVESLKQLLYSLQQVMGTLTENSNKLSSIVSNTNSASKQFKPLLRQSQETLLMLQTQIFPKAYNTLSALDQMTHMMTGLTSEIKDNPTIFIRGQAMPKPGPGEQPERQKAVRSSGSKDYSSYRPKKGYYAGH